MKRKLTKVLGLVVVAVLMVACIASLAACSPKDTSSGTLVIAYSPFNQKFSPFFSSTAYDQDVWVITSINLLSNDRGGNVVTKGIEGETVSYNGKDYTYYGLSDLTITQNEDGTVDYRIQMRTGNKAVKFSDGKTVTVKDAIFSMYAFSDVDYDGSSTFYSLPIKGMNEWRTNLSTEVYNKWAAKADAIVATFDEGSGSFVYAASEAYTQEEYNALVAAINAESGAWTALANDIISYCVANYSGTSYMSDDSTDYAYFKNSEVALGMGMWGFGGMNEDGSFTDVTEKTYDMTTTFPTVADYAHALFVSYDGNIFEAADVEAANGDINDYIAACVEPWIAESGKAEMNGASINSISGITFDEKKGWINVTTTEYDATVIYQFLMPVAPMHYYGDTSKWDPKNGSYGFERGNLDKLREKTTTPMGAGPYKFVSFEQGIVTFEANPGYWEGCPKTKYVKFKEYNADADKVPALIKGDVDIATPSINEATVTLIKDTNKSDLLVVNENLAIATDLVDYNGYGYIGIDANRVKVGSDKASAESKNLRKAFATLFGAYREYTVNSYYEDRASVIEYPITNCSWAAPQPADEGYTTAFAKDVNGNAIYTANMTEQQKWDAAKLAAIGFFQAAGYTWNGTTFTAAPAGASLTYKASIGGDGTGDHPTYALLVKSKEVLATIGITLDIKDYAQSSQLFSALDAGELDIWVAAWGGAADPDMYQVYHSDNKTNSNHYHIADANLDAKIIAARKSTNKAYRMATYKECLDIILDWAVEIPVYQRKDCAVYRSASVKIASITPDTTPYWNYLTEIHKIEVKGA